jgi:hypothetical protein
MSFRETERAEHEQRVLARWDRRPKVALRGLPLFLWGALYVLVGLPVVCLGLIGTLAGWSSFGFGPDSGLMHWWEIALGGLVPLCLGCLVLFGMVVLTGKRERRVAWKLCLWLGIAASAFLAVTVIPYIVVLFIVLGRSNLPWDFATLLLFGGPPTMSVMAWRRLHRGSTEQPDCRQNTVP